MARTLPIIQKPLLHTSKHTITFIKNNYLLYDKFTTALAAGSVNNTSAEPIGGARTVTDTNSKISIANRVLTIATGAAVNNGTWYSSQARLLGKVALFDVILPATAARLEFGWDSSAGGDILDAINFGATTALYVRVNAALIVVGTYEAATYKIAVVMRTVGMAFYIKGGATYPYWTLLYMSVLGSAAGLPGFSVRNAAHIAITSDNWRVPKRLYIPVPLQSDGFSAETTDGTGNAEANGPVGSAYTNVGTWGVAAGVRSCSVLSGTDGKSYLPCTSSNILINVVCTRSAGVAGIVARYVDVENYLIAYLDGTNAKLDKIVAGITTNLISAAVTYNAAFVLSLILDGASARLFYNNLAVGTVATTPAAGSLNHGLYTTNTGATFDNLVIWARGNEEQYASLNAY